MYAMPPTIGTAVGHGSQEAAAQRAAVQLSVVESFTTGRPVLPYRGTAVPFRPANNAP